MIGGGAGRRAETQRRIEEEIRREQAAALGRAGERLDAALAETQELAAIGLRNHRAVDQLFPEPPRRA